MALPPIMPISPISIGSAGGVGNAVQSGNATASAGTSATGGQSFASTLADQLDKVSAAQANADQLALQAATGDLQSIQDYTIASTEAQLMTQLTVAIRNKAVEAFNEIMRMQV
jgi:flagellar hook-basal body complex protein FliE